MVITSVAYFSALLQKSIQVNVVAWMMCFMEQTKKELNIHFLPKTLKSNSQRSKIEQQCRDPSLKWRILRNYSRANIHP